MDGGGYFSPLKLRSLIYTESEVPKASLLQLQEATVPKFSASIPGSGGNNVLLLLIIYNSV